ncbi:hypothetical protein JOQ06_015483, partial [Pogonophryne albipinna]
KFDDHWLSNEKTHDVDQTEKHEMKFSEHTEEVIFGGVACDQRPQGVSVPCNTTSTSEENNQDHIIKSFVGIYAWLWTVMLDRSFLMISLTVDEKRGKD